MIDSKCDIDCSLGPLPYQQMRVNCTNHITVNFMETKSVIKENVSLQHKNCYS